ncbi:DUF397 domain-containing protein [Streptomyces sp. T-3]|nr:DUF397 domain-containing protein [Streptomyces sp. T-3]
MQGALMDDRTPAEGKLQWRKSSYSGGSGTECVEVAASSAFGDRTARVAVRDSKNPLGSRLSFDDKTWAGFVHALRKHDLN